MAANMLHRAGHDVRVLEKASASLDGRGAGIVTHKPLMTALARCGLTVDASVGVAVKERVVLAKDGAVIERIDMPQMLTSWSRLYAMLNSAFDPARQVRGAAVTQVSQSTAGVLVQCDDGRMFDADLAIACDGVRSVVRAQYLPKVQAQYAGYTAWRGVCEESALSQHTLRSVFDTFGFGLPPGEQLIGYPVAGAGNTIERGQRRYNYVWYRPASEAVLQELMTDADGNYFAQGIAPNKVAWQHIAGARQAARALLAPQFAEMLEKTAQPFLQPIYDICSPQMTFGRIALLGDAAFVARPHVGMGVTKAAEDASTLTSCIATHGATPDALHAYETMRLSPCTAVVERARLLGAYIQAGHHTLARDARTVMLGTAIDLSDEHAAQMSALSA